MLPRRFQSILSKMLPCFPASMLLCFPASLLLQMRPALPEGLWPMLVHLSGAPRCSCLVHLPFALGTCTKPSEGPAHCTKFTLFKTSAWACAYYVYQKSWWDVDDCSPLHRTWFAKWTLYSLHCSPHNVDISTSHFGTIIWNSEHFLYKANIIHIICVINLKRFFYWVGKMTTGILLNQLIFNI